MSIVFVHVPKTAGMALQEALSHSLPARDIRFIGYNNDSQHYPLRYQLLERLIRRRWQRAPHTIAFYQRLWQTVCLSRLPHCTFGHINLKRYSLPTHNGWTPHSAIAYIGFMREPLNRAISHYYYTIAKSQEFPNNSQFKRFQREFPTLNDFIISQRYANFQTQYLFFAHQFQFIGITEYMPQSIEVLRTMFPLFRTLSTVQMVNQGTKNTHEIASLSAESIATFKAQNDYDYALYDSLVAKFTST